MPRDLPVGNGRLLITFDSKYQIRDFYFPHPGRENQSSGKPFRFGVWADGLFSWIASDEWTRDFKYQDQTLVTQVTLRNERMKLEMVSNDIVDFFENVFVRHLTVQDMAGQARQVKIFFHHDFYISESPIGDTAYYDPTTTGLVHYKRNRYFLAGCRTAGKETFDQWATGNKAVNHSEGTWRDAEDGVLGGNSIAQGSVDSTIGIALEIPPGGRQSLDYWIVAAKTHREALIADKVVREKTPAALIKRTADYWRAWVNKESFNFAGLPQPIVEAFKRSLLIIRTNLDENGAILAANDSDAEAFNADTYSYVWPRDGALTAYALDIAGFAELTRRFYRFMKTLITPDGYFLHKYTPDGTVGSSWLPWIENGQMQLPIQEDETALMLWGLWKHYNEHRDIEFISEFYLHVIKKAADFMCAYRDSQTGLPLPSWDLWEERRAIHTFTLSTVWAGLQAAARFASLFGEQELTQKYLKASAEIKDGMVKYLFRQDLGRFAKSVNLVDKGQAAPEINHDTTIDASLLGIWYFGMLAADDPMVQSTMRAVRERLWVKTQVGGLARYENDHYHQVSSDTNSIPGNPWFICTLWVAEYDIALARTAGEMAGALDMINWVISHALPSGVLAEQVNPNTDEPLSVSPLTWSHSQLIAAIMSYLEKVKNLSACQSCGQTSFDYVRRDTGVIPATIPDFQEFQP